MPISTSEHQNASDRLDALVSELRARATALGFEAFGIADAAARPEIGARLAHALENGWHADMDWMETTAERRASPTALWAEARSVIMLGLNYGPQSDPLETLSLRETGTISVYARNRDYHEIIKGRLKEIAGLLARRSGGAVKVFVDTAPLMEKPLAEAAGIGWQGKHSVLVSRDFGSWLFLGAILTDFALPASTPIRPSCGTCRKCLDICPTDAFAGPYRLDARKCLAYLSVEHKGPIPMQYRVAMGNRIYGCDDCLAVCPWNKFAKATSETRLEGRPEFERPDLGALAALDDVAFRNLFSGSPIKRIGHARFLRNVMIGVGNSASMALWASAEARIADPETLIRGAAVWALRRLDPDRAAALRGRALREETDPVVIAEWRAAA